jgi:glycosyltransferase involved in cell wall biosynthesis
LRYGYLTADAIVAVSNGVADDLATTAKIPRQRISTIYNPVVGPDILDLAEEPLDHPWFDRDAPPVILAAGRISPQKDYSTLIRAFSRVHAKRKVRLIILGAEGHGCADYVQEVRSLASQHPIAEDVLFAGFVANPFAYMARASLFVLSSAYEGLPGVLIQALACGCPVVSTDCPSGPMEILDGGRYGALVPVGNETAMAEAIATTLDNPIDAAVLKARADYFSIDQAIDGYLRLLLPLVAGAEKTAAYR